MSTDPFPPDELADFSGRVRIFPLPDTVLFPHALQMLHIFEPRYREMMAAALEDDKLIAIARLQPGWEQDYEGRPAVFPVACVGRVATHHKFPDGRYNLMLKGLARVRIVRELPPEKSFREAEAELLQETAPPPDSDASISLREKLTTLFQQMFKPEDPAATKHFETLFRLGSLGAMVDVMAHAMSLDADFKQSLLEQLHVERRAKQLFARLATTLQQKERPFPPPFSEN